MEKEHGTAEEDTAGGTVGGIEEGHLSDDEGEGGVEEEDKKKKKKLKKKKKKTEVKREKHVCII